MRPTATACGNGRRADGVPDLVELDDRYLDVAELGRAGAAADVVLLPYDSREQVTSGVLIEAVAAGRPVVSTAFPHADRAAGRRDRASWCRNVTPAALEAALRRVLSEPGLADGMAEQAARQGPRACSGPRWPAATARSPQRLVASAWRRRRHERAAVDRARRRCSRTCAGSPTPAGSTSTRRPRHPAPGARLLPRRRRAGAGGRLPGARRRAGRPARAVPGVRARRAGTRRPVPQPARHRR